LRATLVVKKGPGAFEFISDAPGNFICAENRRNNGQVIPGTRPAMRTGVS